MPFLADQQATIPVTLPPVVNPSQERVLFAFNEYDRAQFFPAYHDFTPGEGNRTWVDTSAFKSSEDWVDYLKETLPTVLVSCWSTPMLPESLLLSDSFPLRYICHTTGTVKGKFPREFVARGGIATNWGNVISHNVAEHALLLILASLRKINSWREASKSKDVWGMTSMLRTSSLRGKKVGLHGFGNVARELILLLQPFDVELRAYSQNVAPSYIREKGCIPCHGLKELFQESEIIVECEALTPQSAGSITEELLRLLPQGGLFVNVGRGSLVDEEALIRVVADGQVMAALDVVENEPLPANSPLWKMTDNVVLSPHIAGPTGDWFHRCGDYAMDNVERYLTGRPLNGVVTVEIYDRTT